MALQAIAKELEREPDNANLWKEHGRLSMLTGDKATAMQSLRKAGELNPNLLSDLSGEFDNKAPHH